MRIESALITPARGAFAAAALLALSSLGMGGDAAAPGEGAAPPTRVDARADEVMKKMAALLAGAKTFTLEMEETFDAEFARAYRIQLTAAASSSRFP